MIHLFRVYWVGEANPDVVLMIQGQVSPVGPPSWQNTWYKCCHLWGDFSLGGDINILNVDCLVTLVKSFLHVILII